MTQKDVQNPPLANYADPYDLVRFYIAQEENYLQALGELKAGKKKTHWMWYVFPQLEGLAHSNMAQFYAIKSREEALAFVQHPILGKRLIESTAAVLQHRDQSLRAIFGKPDDKKFCSCMTLFSIVSQDPIFTEAITIFCDSTLDPKTIQILQSM